MQISLTIPEYYRLLLGHLRFDKSLAPNVKYKGDIEVRFHVLLMPKTSNS